MWTLHGLGALAVQHVRTALRDEEPAVIENAIKHTNIIGNKKMFNVLLYKGDFVKKNSEKSYFRYYKDAYDHIFENHLLMGVRPRRAGVK